MQLKSAALYTVNHQELADQGGTNNTQNFKQGHSVTNAAQKFFIDDELQKGSDETTVYILLQQVFKKRFSTRILLFS